MDISSLLLLGAKVSILIFIAMYTIFSYIVFTQVRTLDRIVIYKQEQIIEVIALVQIVLGASLFVFALVIL